MIQLRTGVDILETDRMQGIRPEIRKRFIQRVYTELEQEQCGDSDQALVARFSGKEAVSKALGTGIGFVAWREIEILEKPSGAPYVVLHGRAQAVADALGIQVWSISLSHSRNLAVAFVVAWGPEAFDPPFPGFSLPAAPPHDENSVGQ
jgi:holo-[acyl-carrier protein] synthase